MFTWYRLADLCADEGIPFVLGHALFMKAIHGDEAKNEQIDSQKIAVLLRGGMLPHAYVSPAEMRSIRDLFRRRMPLGHKRGALLAHVQNTNSQYNLPAIGKKIADKANRDGVEVPRSYRAYALRDVAPNRAAASAKDNPRRSRCRRSKRRIRCRVCVARCSAWLGAAGGRDGPLHRLE